VRTLSSSATLLTSIRIAEQSVGICKGPVEFLLLLGARMNLSATAVFEGILVPFVAQDFGVDPSIVEQALLVALCVLTSISASDTQAARCPT
jgi:DAACS family dicarboxylate/amino acid:cation (Na+ or H+) symporter